MAIDPINTRTIAIDELPSAPFNTTDYIAHGIGADLKKGTIEEFSTFLSTYLGVIGGVGFRAVTVPDGGTLPATTQEEFILVGPGTITNVGGGADITTTEELNALVSNGTYWFIGVEIPINVELAGITQFIRSGFTNTTPSEDAVFNALADLSSGGSTQSDTGVMTFAGLFTNSSTTINIGAAEGYVVDNETDPFNPVKTFVTYSGEANKTVTTVGSGIASYVMLSSTGVISFQNTFPTSAERKAKIWLGKVSHPLGVITLVVNEPDYILSPLAFSRDWFQDLGPYVNNGVYPYANGANLNINITGGTITGDGINFVNSKTNPNRLSSGAASVATFTYRSQTGAGGAVTAVTPGFYDVGGVVTAIPGSTNQATIQYFSVLPGIGYVAQLGQTIYPTFAAAVAALGKESFVKYPSFVGNVLPIAALVVTKGCTALNDTGVTAQFFNANKNGDFFGSSAGTSTATLQSAYNNSVEPEIVTNSSLDGFTVRRGSASDTDNIIVGQNGANTVTFAVTGQGNVTMNNLSALITSNNQVGTTYTVVAADNGKQVILSNASAVTVTIPSGLPTGFNCKFYQQGTGKVSFTTSGGTVLRYQTYELPQTEEQYSIVGMENVTNLSGVYKLYGQLQSL